MSKVLPKFKVIQIRRGKKNYWKNMKNKCKSNKIYQATEEIIDETEITLTEIGSPTKMKALKIPFQNNGQKTNYKRKKEELDAHSFVDLEEVDSTQSYKDLMQSATGKKINLHFVNPKVIEKPNRNFNVYWLQSILYNRIKDEQFNHEIHQNNKEFISRSWEVHPGITPPYPNKFNDFNFIIQREYNSKIDNLRIY